MALPSRGPAGRSAPQRRPPSFWTVSRGGRPPALKGRDLVRARALLRDPELSIAEVAEAMGVGVATLYRHLPGGRGAVTGSGE